MHYNILSYWRHLQNLPDGHEDKPRPRVCRLMLDLFEKWRSRQAFPEWDCLGHVRDDPGAPRHVMQLPLAERRGWAMQRTLARLVSPWARHHGFAAVHPDELIVGVMPPYSVGQGKEVMGYLKDERDDHDETLEFEIGYLNGWSNFGHIAPDHEAVVKRGVRDILTECADFARAANTEQRSFYESVRLALEGVLLFAAGYAELARVQAARHRTLLDAYPEHPTRELFEQRMAGMNEVAARLERIPAEPSESFADAVQCVFLMNCALHWTGELTSLGRLDQILFPYYQRSGLSRGDAQEIVDCLWVKFDERVMLDARHFEDRFSSADGALLGGVQASNFDQGALANQWMQQVTLGGVLANGRAKPVDASNDLTRMCLEAARKFPFNCPTVDLRVHRRTPKDLLDLAARAILSGGAHPILMNDDKLIPALHHDAGGNVDLASARNYACDGCYETLFPGETEFSFFYVPGVDALEKAFNSGAGLGASGAAHLRGSKDSFRSPPAEQIESFAQFYRILENHIRLNVHRQLSRVLKAYGCKGRVCPSPILSAMVAGCLASGRDFYDGGARYHMFSPLMTGISTVADSLYVIDELVFRQARFSLAELTACLRSDWGTRHEVVGLQLPQARVDEIRARCLVQPKFGTGVRDVDQWAWKVIRSFVDAVHEARNHPIHAADFARLKQRYDLPGRPFELLLTPGVGTFEQYVFGGGWSGATPDGRRSGDSLAPDLSASPLPARETVPPRCAPPQAASGDAQASGLGHGREPTLFDALDSWSDESIHRLSDGAPSDFNIREDFPHRALVKVLTAFARGRGSNIMTVTVANPETLLAAEQAPSEYELVRVRMGGWTEFYVVLSSRHKEHHRRRRLYAP
jgi:pyruvate-formate lyase